MNDERGRTRLSICARRTLVRCSARLRVAEPECGYVVDRDEIDAIELGVQADAFVGDRQVIRRRQTLLLGSVSGIGLDLLVEQLTDERGEQLVRGHGTEPAGTTHSVL